MAENETRSKLDELEVMKRDREAKLGKSEPKSTPPVVDLKVTFTDAEGVTNTCTLPARVMDRDEILDVHRLAAIHAGIDIDLLGREGKSICLDRALVEIMWKDKVPEWLKTAMAKDEGIASQLSVAVNSHRTAYFRGDYRARKEGAKASGLEVVPVLPAAPDAK